jgi:FkbM family methyltransferase
MPADSVKIHPLPLLLRGLQHVEFPHKLGIMDRMFGRQLSAAGTVWVQTAARIHWKLDLSYAPSRWIVYGMYEGPAFLEWAREFLAPDSVVVDSGANIGQMLLYLAQWVPDGIVLAFEPGRRQAAWLKECLDEHPNLPVVLMPFGLGDRNGPACLRECGPANVQGAWNQVSDSEGESIRLVRLADALSDRGLDHVDLWKLDVEGFEVNALKGAEELLLERRIRAVYVELAGENGSRVREYMASVGYKIFLLGRHGSMNPANVLPEHTNALFLPAS